MLSEKKTKANTNNKNAQSATNGVYLSTGKGTHGDQNVCDIV